MSEVQMVAPVDVYVINFHRHDLSILMEESEEGKSSIAG